MLLQNYQTITPLSRKNDRFVSKGKASPLTAKLKCPHGNGEDTPGAEAVAEVARDGFAGLLEPGDRIPKLTGARPSDLRRQEMDYDLLYLNVLRGAVHEIFQSVLTHDHGSQKADRVGEAGDLAVDLEKDRHGTGDSMDGRGLFAVEIATDDGR